MSISKHLLLIICVGLLTSCSNPLRVHYTNIRLAILLNEDISISKQEVLDSKVDLALIKSGTRPKALIAKAFEENGNDKWISEDRAMLVVKHGRVVRTIGFPNDQLGIYTAEPDPLTDFATANEKSWFYLVDWSVGEYGYRVESSFLVQEDVVSIFDEQFSTYKVTEELVYKVDNGLFRTDPSWTNEYWYHRESGKILKTSQQAAPFSDRFDITFVSNAASLN